MVSNKNKSGVKIKSGVKLVHLILRPYKINGFEMKNQVSKTVEEGSTPSSPGIPRKPRKIRLSGFFFFLKYPRKEQAFD